jgi:hypothetical protein
MAITQPFPLFPILGYCTLGIMGNVGQFIGGYVAVVSQNLILISLIMNLVKINTIDFTLI